MYLSEGRLIYTLDDPYIHLAVARNILLGGYGVNVGEYSSPSSSLLWPWLMAGTEFAGLGTAGPLVVNGLAAAATILVACRFLVKNGIVGAGSPLRTAFLGILVILLTSGVGLPLTGMEHSLHVLLTVMVLDGLVDAAERRQASWYLVPAIVLLPFVRFEGAALSIGAIVLLFWFGRRAAAGVAVLLMLAGFAGYAAFAATRGLPFFPSSVLIKSGAVSSASGDVQPIRRILHEVKMNLISRAGMCLMLAGAMLALAALLQLRTHFRMALVYALVAGCIGAHLLVGKIGWFYRYEVYCVALAGFLILQAFVLLSRQNRLPRFSRFAVIALLALMALDYALAAVTSPLAARNMYEQQYQMRRFVFDFHRQPVAVNDLGLVTYGNQAYVLDLWGLGSEEVRKLRATQRYDAAAMARLARERNVGLVMIYDEWYPAVPAEWTPVATLTTTDNYSAGGERVTFHATPQADLPALRAALEAFATTVPARVEFRLEGAGTGENTPPT